MFQTEAVLKHFQFLYREVAHKMYAQPPDPKPQSENFFKRLFATRCNFFAQRKAGSRLTPAARFLLDR